MPLSYVVLEHRRTSRQIRKRRKKDVHVAVPDSVFLRRSNTQESRPRLELDGPRQHEDMALEIILGDKQGELGGDARRLLIDVTEERRCFHAQSPREGGLVRETDADVSGKSAAGRHMEVEGELLNEDAVGRPIDFDGGTAWQAEAERRIEIQPEVPRQSEEEHPGELEERFSRESGTEVGYQTECDPQNSSSESEEDSVPGHQRLPKLDHWQKLLPILIVFGSVKFARDQYASLVRLSTFFNNTQQLSWRKVVRKRNSDDCNKAPYAEVVFPCYRTMMRGMKSLLVSKLAARGNVKLHSVSSEKAGASIRAFSTYEAGGESMVGKAKVKVIPVSEYARMDVACNHVYQQMRSTDLSSGRFQHDQSISPSTLAGSKSWQCIDDWPLVADRHGFYGNSHPIGVDVPDKRYESSSNMAEVGDVLLVKAFPEYNLNDTLREQFSRDPRPQWAGANVLFGNVRASWSADQIQAEHANCRRIADNLTEDENRILKAFCLRGTSSKLPGVFCKAGDTFTLLAPNTSCDGYFSRILIVHRFISLEAESNSFLLWIRERIFSANLPTDPVARVSSSINCPLSTNEAIEADKIICVSDISVMKERDGPRGSAQSKPIASFGTLMDGKSYVIYRFMLFWDGFKITEGKCASATGIYMVCLNLPVQDRRASAAVRILSVVPPGVRFQEVFRRILKDISKGMTEGIDDYDADGRPVRIFLDHVCNVGDTPALNEAIDVLGHQGSACCHLCRFVREIQECIVIGREEYVIGSRFTSTEISGSKEFARRSMARHEALSNSAVDDDTRNKLGFKPADFDGILGLHEFALAFESMRDQIPRDSNGERILPSVLDPYMSLLVGPDHLLTGHGRDCVNSALKLMSPASRLEYETFALSAMKDCSLTMQNRIVDRSKAVLFSMSLSELYTVIFVSEYALLKAMERSNSDCGRHSNCNSTEGTREGRVYAAINLVGSISRLIGKILYWPQERIDGLRSVYDYNSELGFKRIRTIQHAVKAHITKVGQVCTIDSDTARKLRETTRSRRRNRAQEKSLIMKDVKDTVTARAVLDKPNVHRLLELTEVVLPMVGHITRISELVFEKAHQAIKRAIKRSNNRNFQLECMNAVALNDWKGRLTMTCRDLQSDDLDKQRRAQLGIFRLLKGREEVMLRRGNLSDSDIKMVSEAIGPKEGVRAVLEQEGRQVICSDGSPHYEDLRWTILKDDKKRLDPACCYDYSEVSSSGTEREGEHGSAVRSLNTSSLTFFTDQVRTGTGILASIYGNDKFRQGKRIKPINADGKNCNSSYELRSGDVIQALTLHSEDSSRNSRFVTLSTGDRAGSAVEEVSFWYILFFFEVSTGHGAMVLPCDKVMDQNDRTCSGLQLPKYSISKSSGGPHVLFLNSSCRKVGILHDCDRSCGRRFGQLHITHNAHILGANFFVIDRAHGYPPRSI